MLKKQAQKLLSQDQQKSHYIHHDDLNELVCQLWKASEEEIFSTICQILRRIVNAESVAIASFDSVSQTIKLKVFNSDSQNVNFSNQKTYNNINLKISHQLIKDYKEEQIIECKNHKNCLIDLFSAVFKDLIKTYHQNKFYRLSWVCDNELIAVGLIQLTKDLKYELKKYVETFLGLSVKFIQQKKIEEDLKYSNEQLNSILNTTNDAVILINKDFNIISWNLAVETMFKYSHDEILNRSLYNLIPKELFEKHTLLFSELSSSFGIKKTIETHGIKKDTTFFPIELSVNNWGVSNESYCTLIVHDITERKLAEDRLKATINEKVTLLQEIHHRVKNNMQVISSLLYLQAKKIKNKKTKEIFNECMNRVRSMSLIHEKLYQSADFINIYYLKDYINDLIKSLYLSYNIDYNKIKFDVHVDNISLYIDFAVPLGLIINELVSNSLKHAFPQPWDRIGEIKISLTLTYDGMINFNYKDNGVGLPEDIDLANTKSLGLSLITGFVTNQLYGTINVIRDKGTEFQILFKKNKLNRLL